MPDWLRALQVRRVTLAALVWCCLVASSRAGEAKQETPAAAPAPAKDFNLTSDATGEFDAKSGDAVFLGNARLTYGAWTLVADEIRYNQKTGAALAKGNVVFFRPGLRLLADTVRYRTVEHTVELTGVRFGRPPVNIEGESGFGVLSTTPGGALEAEELTIENARIIYGEPGPLAPHATARRLNIHKDDRIDASGLRFSLGMVPVLALSGLSRPLDAPGLQWETRAGFDTKLGVHAGAGVYAPVWGDIRLGGSFDEFTSRGLLIGPGARYGSTRDDGATDGTTDFGYIRDTGDRGTRGRDTLGQQVGEDRFFWSWRHTQSSDNGRWTLNGALNWWSDSAVVRDFRDEEFNDNQQPDSFLEATLNGSNYMLSAFTRIRPNDFQLVPERLPEIRFDLMPTPVGKTGALLQLETSAALLREKSLDGSPELKSDRFDLYSGLSRTFTLTRGITFTPVAGGRLTYYDRAEGGRDNYTRWLGEVGFDASMRAYSTRELKNPIWGIDGIRHIIEPRIEYRYVPSAQRGHQFIPDIDRPAFLTQLQPLGLADRRDIDDLDEIHTVRFGLNNTIETRREDYGSRQLAQFDLATDFYLSKPTSERRGSDVQAEMHLTPADWMEGWFFLRVDPEHPSLREFNSRVAIMDGQAWSAGVDVDFLQYEIGQTQLFGRYEIDEATSLHGSVRFDAREDRFNEVQVQLWRQISQNWLARFGVTFRDGQRREGDFGVKFDLRFLSF